MKMSLHIQAFKGSGNIQKASKMINWALEGVSSVINEEITLICHKDHENALENMSLHLEAFKHKLSKTTRRQSAESSRVFL